MDLRNTATPPASTIIPEWRPSPRPGFFKGLAPTFFFLVLLTGAVQAGTPRPPAAAIATAHPLATRAGHEILAKGGNAFDAAVAVTAALAVVEPTGAGLGGGGFWLLHRSADGFETMVDGRERAPLAATANMFLGEEGRVIPGLSLDGPLAAAIPGIPAALPYIARKYGRLPLGESLAPAIRYAVQGFKATPRFRRLAEWRLGALDATAVQVFLDGGFIPEEGDLIRQPDLARTLRRIAKHGRKGFYGGDLARRLVKGVRDAGGIWQLKDLQAYRVVERAPVTGRYRGIDVTSAAPPSSGGVALVQMLNILDGFKLDSMSRIRRFHILIEAMRRAYRDRARFLGDPDYIPIDIRRLVSPAYASELGKTIGMVASPSRAMRYQARPGGEDTTHFSLIDREGNRVAATLSSNYPFGSGFMPPGTGVLLNNEMDDFSVKPGMANAYGLIGTGANTIAPGKRPLSSMTPTFLETTDAVVILGTPGGSRIITMVLLAALEFAHGRGGIADWVALPRFHHQYLPDVVTYEPEAFSKTEVRALQKLGHRLSRRETGYGNMQAVIWNKKNNRLRAASDPRGEGLAGVE